MCSFLAVPICPVAMECTDPVGENIGIHNSCTDVNTESELISELAALRRA